MIRAQPLFESELVGIARFDHPAGRRHRDPDEELSTSHTVSFVLRGTFGISRGRKSWRLAPDTLFVTRPGFAYRCHHDEPVPDDVCLSITYAPEFLDEAGSFAAHPFGTCAPAVHLTNRLAYARGRLERILHEEPEPVAVETAAGEIMAGISGSGTAPSSLFSDRQISWYAQRVDAARQVMEQRFAEPHTLRSLAREAGMSPFHFARIFRQLTGSPPHRYLVSIRLARAAGMLRDGAGVTETALATGFNNLSHFIRLFRRTYGTSPSRVR